jgi:hypothetical protein
LRFVGDLQRQSVRGGTTTDHRTDLTPTAHGPDPR